MDADIPFFYVAFMGVEPSSWSNKCSNKLLFWQGNFKQQLMPTQQLWKPCQSQQQTAQLCTAIAPPLMSASRNLQEPCQMEIVLSLCGLTGLRSGVLHTSTCSFKEVECEANHHNNFHLLCLDQLLIIYIIFTHCSCQKRQSVSAVKLHVVAANFLALARPARSKEEPIDRGHGTQYVPPPASRG